MREMKNSGVAWIGNIPKAWGLIRYKDKYKNSKEIAGDKSRSYDRLALSLNGVIKRPKDDSDGLQPKEFDTYQVLHENDFVFKMIDLQNISTSRVGLSPYTGLVSPAYIRFCPKNKKQYPRFIYYFLMSMYYNCVFNNLGGDGVRSALNSSDMGNFLIPYPIEIEQHRIVDYLDTACSKINLLIVNQQTQIEKLKQYKQSLITEVVTKGLNPDVPMKDSGVKWIGMIPKHWIVKRTKFVANALEKGKGITKEEVISDGDIQCVRYGEIYTKYNQGFTDCVSRTNLEIIQPHQFFEHGDILFAGTGELVEEIGKNVVYLGNEKCLAGGDIIVMKHHQDPAFLNYALNSIYSQKQKSYGKAKLKVVHISADNIGNVKIALPPLNEQQRIATYLDNKCAKIDRLIAIKQEKIDKLNDYKKSLIYEYVTGKKEA
ncbi:restriction endonuclease subunit S [Eubacterium coprostanoligenes]|uniref:Type I restriction enzyme, S subunit n=1 Tax=Eubacterium coprostanoligenes TaxID=290054 RepID=A0A1T4N5S8_9FIRM|nr:restriction endonuclease subunit S [Eubacterium coprostanoligenes]SJZ74659.1 type I restriction enzyme, S subunit [Eubacterium coprostanoligenes]